MAANRASTSTSWRLREATALAVVAGLSISAASRSRSASSAVTWSPPIWVTSFTNARVTASSDECELLATVAPVVLD